MSATSPVISPYPIRSVLTGAQRSSPAPLFVIIAMFMVLCVPLAAYLNIWQDEAYSLHTTSGGLTYALQQGLGFEAQAPLYFVMLAAWRDVNTSAFFARLLSIVFSIGTLMATWAFVRRYISTINSGFILAAVAFNPFTVWAAVEIRPYAAVIMLSAVLSLLFFVGFLDERPGRAARIAYLCVAIAGTYTQYYVAFLIPAHLFVLIMLRQWASAKHLLISGSLLGLSLVPLAIILPQQFQSYHAFAVAFKIPSYAMATVLLGYPFPHGWIDTWAHQPLQNTFYLFVALVPFALGAGYLKQLRATTKALLLMLIALFAMYTSVIVITHVQVIIPRHTLVMLVPLLLGCFALIGDVVRPQRSLVLASYATIYLLFAGFSLWHDFHGLSKVGDWQRVSNFVAGAARPGDGIALFNAEAELPFRYYFARTIPVTPIPRTISFQEFDEQRFVLHSNADVANSLGHFAAKHRHIWLVESEACEPKSYAFFGCHFLAEYVRAQFTTVNTVKFNGTTVLELKHSTSQARL